METRKGKESGPNDRCLPILRIVISIIDYGVLSESLMRRLRQQPELDGRLPTVSC